MTIDDIISVLSAIKIPLFNQVGEAGTSLPYGVLTIKEPNNTAADNKNYCINLEGTLELYTLYKDYDLCYQVESALNDAKLPWSHVTDYVSGQKTFLEVYNFGTVSGQLQRPPKS